MSRKQPVSKYDSEPHFVAFWGDGVRVELFPTADEWQALVDGGIFSIDGGGYYYEGQFFSDTWMFQDGLNGELEITYTQADDEFGYGVGFVGSARDILINDERLTVKPSKILMTKQKSKEEFYKSAGSHFLPDED